MSLGLKPYPAYKDSGIEWLGQVPEHWEVRRIRNAVDMRVSNVDKHTAEGEIPVRLCNYVDVYKNERITDGIQFMKATASTDEIERFRLNNGDVLITKDSESWNDIGVPALVEYAAPDLVCGYHLAVLRPRRSVLDSGFLLRAMQSSGISYQLHVEANGVTRYGLSHAAIKSVWLPLPPSHEQAGIVRFLDYMDHRIRHYIRSKQKLIKLLEEQKQVIIHQAVTGQIDVRTGKPYPAYKDSGVEWLGQVPDQWQVRKVSRCLKNVVSGVWGEEPSDANMDEHVVCVRVADFDITKLRVSKQKLTVRAIPRSAQAARLLKVGDILIEKSGGGDAQPVGRVVLFDLDVPAVTSNFVSRLRVQKHVARPKFLLHVLALLQSRRINVPSIKQTTGIQNLDEYEYFSTAIGVPAIDEQDAILAWIGDGVQGLDIAIDRERRAIGLLREYRTRLIADVVTGKLDVREAAGNLPDEAEEPELLADEDLLADESEVDDTVEDEAALEEVEA